MKKNADQRKTDKWVSKVMITVNMPTLTGLLTTYTLSDLPCSARGAKVAVEIGAAGNLHKHMYIALTRSVRLSWFYKNFPGAETDAVTPGTEQTVIDYIGSADKTVSKGCVVLPEYTSIIGDIETTQGKRNDISQTDDALWQIKEAIDSGCNARQIWQDFFPYMVRYGRGIADYMALQQTAINDNDTAIAYRVKANSHEIEAEKQEKEREAIRLERELIEHIRDKALSFVDYM